MTLKRAGAPDGGPGHAPSRRSFLAGAAGAGALLVAGQATAAGRAGQAAALNAWVAVAPDGQVTISLSQSEMGQGVATTLPAALADELGADWSRVTTEWAPFDPAYRFPQYQWMFTGNSESVSTFYEVMRRMGAGAREMLKTAAAERFGVSPERLAVKDGVMRDPTSGRSVTFGEVAEAAAKIAPPKDPPLKPDREQALIGRALPRRDIPAKVDGSAVFGIDVQVPGMAVAAIRRAPSRDGRLVSWDRAIAHRPGVLKVVEIPSGLAVVAERYWTAKRALDDARPVFEAGPLSEYSTASQRAEHAARLASGPFETKAKAGDAPGQLAAAPRRIEAVYEIPAQAHATMEPMNGTAHVTAERCELWLPTQGVELAQGVARELTGLPDEKIVIHRTLLGGGFGRRLLGDFVKVAILVAQAADRPVKTIWSREEDFRYDAYRTPMTHRIEAALGADGRPLAMAHRVVSPSHMQYVFPRPAIGVKSGWDRPVAPPVAYDAMAVEGVIEPPYEVPNYLVEQHYEQAKLPVSVWRTTGHGPNNFALESFIDELANAAGQDPLAYRLALTKDPRATAVLKAAADMAGWGRPPPAGSGRGVALAKAFNGYIAQVAEVALSGRDIRVRRVWSAVDCGRVLDPGIAASNIEGGVVWGLSGLRTEVTFARGEVQQTNFDGFDPVHLWETPQIETRFVDSGAKPGGTGELGPVPTHAAVCNAIAAAGGPRVRTLPIGRAGLRLT